ncbi:hypothetical protein, partial [Neptuniibacter sp. UBA6509]
KTMTALLGNVEVRRYLKQDNVYELSCFDRVLAKDVLVLWSNESELSLSEYMYRRGMDSDGLKVVDKLGLQLDVRDSTISDSPIYVV